MFAIFSQVISFEDHLHIAWIKGGQGGPTPFVLQQAPFGSEKVGLRGPSLDPLYCIFYSFCSKILVPTCVHNWPLYELLGKQKGSRIQPHIPLPPSLPPLLSISGSLISGLNNHA